MFSDAFVYAFDHAMIYEIGAWFDPTDAEVILGACATPAQKKKVGYVNIKEDTGGLTKYGIAQNANLEVDVQNLTLVQAMDVYYNKYWLAGRCDKLINPAVTIFQFDMTVNHGLSRAAKILQQACGVVADGVLGPKSLAAANAADPAKLIKEMSAIREARYHAIVKANATQAKFLKGWLRRNDEVTKYALEKLNA